jgi:hypothetical protein
MNDDYEALPENLKVLAIKYKEPYDPTYDYIKDADVFIQWERDTRGLVGYSCFSLANTQNEIAYQLLSLHYSPDVVKMPTNGVFF